MSDIVVNITPPSPIALSYSQGGSAGPTGPQGSVGAAGPVNKLVIGTVVSGVEAAATLSAQTVANGTATQTLNLVLPQGATGSQGIQGVMGPAGPVNVLSVGTVATTSATTASISITGTAPSQVISFVVPRGPQGIQGDAGPFTVVQVGGVTTGAAGTSAKVESVTSGGTVTLSFTIPRGLDGTANLADETPQPLGIASVGSALKAARADHVHTVPVISYSALTDVPLTFSPSAHTHTISDVVNLQATLDSKQPAGNYATLVGGTVPSSMLPGFVDDIIEYGSLSAFPATNDVGKIFTAIDTRKIYRWSGTGYVEISPSPGTTTDVPEGTNLYYTNTRAAAAAPVQSVAGRTGAIALTSSDVGLGNVPNTDATARANHTGTQAASTISDFATEAAKYGPVTSVAGRTGAISLTSSDVGLGNVPNTNATARANHTGTQLSSTISDFATEAAKYGPVTSVSGRTGTVTVAQLGTSGTASSTTFLRGDGAWSEVAGGSGGGSANIVEAETSASFPASGSQGTLYIATSVSRVFRWDVSGVYVELGTSGGGGGASVAGTPPGAPTGLTATAGNAQISLAWTAPSSVGSSAITGYSVEYTPSGGSPTTVSTGSTATSYTITTLTNGTAYTARVAAVNSAGTGSYTAASSSVTPTGQVFRAIPTLTSNTSDGTVEANTGTTANAFRLFDGSSSTQYNTQRNGSNTPLRYFQYTFAGGLKSRIGGYTMSPQDSWYDSINTWELSGSDDGTTFTVIDSRSSVSWASVSDVKTFTLASPANYSTYRWTLTTDGNDAFAGLSSVQLTAF